ncbi:hypothetical protein OsJ_36539 [Oryza sativa Japonica Group]|uniref:Uncharacterized protein n=1 Tax=Oryza sativa subsp. japonica TaxID=39947 RepID=A3CII7_ORYSJ|nr:hypothetical protein OsJ_36539 [Oryza sativa Japonica Group]
MHPLVGALVAGARERWWCRGEGGAAVRHAVAWAGALALAVSVASFAPGGRVRVGAYRAPKKPGGIGDFCAAGALRVPFNGGGDFVCVPARMAVRSGADMIVPPAFAGLAVGASACFVRALAIGRRLDDY